VDRWTKRPLFSPSIHSPVHRSAVQRYNSVLNDPRSTVNSLVHCLVKQFTVQSTSPQSSLLDFLSLQSMPCYTRLTNLLINDRSRLGSYIAISCRYVLWELTLGPILSPHQPPKFVPSILSPLFILYCT